MPRRDRAGHPDTIQSGRELVAATKAAARPGLDKTRQRSLARGGCPRGYRSLREAGAARESLEQRYRSVLDVLEEGVSVTEVARRYGVARQTVHGRCGGMPRRAGWPSDRSSRSGPARIRWRR